MLKKKTMTLEEIYEKTMASEDLKKSFADAVKDDEKLTAWLKAQGCSATVEELTRFMENRTGIGEICDEELENVAGGGMSPAITRGVEVLKTRKGQSGC